MIWADVLNHCDELIAQERKKIAVAKARIHTLQSSKRFFQNECDTSGMKWEQWVESLGRKVAAKKG